MKWIKDGADQKAVNEEDDDLTNMSEMNVRASDLYTLFGLLRAAGLITITRRDGVMMVHPTEDLYKLQMRMHGYPVGKRTR